MQEFIYTGDNWKIGVMILRGLEMYKEQTADSFYIHSTFAHEPQSLTIRIPVERVPLLHKINENLK